MNSSLNMNLQTELKKGLHRIVQSYTGISLSDILEGHTMLGPDRTLVSSRKVTPEMLADINRDIKTFLSATEKKFRTKLPFTFLAEQGTNDQNFTVHQKIFN